MNDNTFLGFLYRANLDDPDIDKDPDFRSVLKFMNTKIGVKTISSCAGHLPGEQYEDVEEIMHPYITLIGEEELVDKLCDLLEGFDKVSSIEVSDFKTLIKFHDSIMKNWGSLLDFLNTNWKN